MRPILQLLRPEQCLKNLFVFLPLFFDRHLFDLEYLLPCLLIFLAFSFAASGIYCFNDIRDAEADRLHEVKRNRPIASGAVSPATGYIIMGVCLVIAVVFLALIPHAGGQPALPLCIIVGCYVLMNIAYSLKLKQLAIVDVFIIAIGFVLRVLAGGVATGIYLSHWIVLMTFLLTLFLAFAKRRDDVVTLEKSGVAVRKSINRYNLPFMNLARLCDVFYIGGTKCGTLLGEAVVFPQRDFVPHFFSITKQHGAVLAKGFVAGLQFDTLFTDNLYFEIGRTAISAANRIRQALREKGYVMPVEAPTNQIFVLLDQEKLEELSAKVEMSFWEKPDAEHTTMRFVTCWATTEEDVQQLIALL